MTIRKIEEIQEALDKRKRRQKWRPSLCDELVSWMGKGLSNIEIAAKLKISEKQFYEWLKTHPDFQDAFDLGDPQRFSFLMERADKNFFEDKNDKGYKHWLKKMHYIYSKYSPETAATASTTNNYQIGNVNMLKYEGRSESELLEILQSKMLKITPSEKEAVPCESTVLIEQLIEPKHDSK